MTITQRRQLAHRNVARRALQSDHERREAAKDETGDLLAYAVIAGFVLAVLAMVYGAIFGGTQ